MSWSVRKLLDFSYCPGINEAYEGDRILEEIAVNDGTLGLDGTFSLDWLDTDGADTNNNDLMTTGGGDVVRPTEVEDEPGSE